MERIGNVPIQDIFKAANEHRDYSIYNRSMDAALLAKAQSIFPHFGQIEEGDIIVDAGSGTGKLADLAAIDNRGAKVYALDMSHELREEADNNRTVIHLVYGNAVEQNFPDNSVTVKYFSTSCHEISSFGSPDSLQRTIRNSYRENRTGGRVVIRDFSKPSRTEPIYMEFLTKVGLPAPEGNTPSENIDYNLLSTPALFDRFHKEFQGGNAFDYEKVTINGQSLIKIAPEWAHEFYLRKDYTANWRQEIKEKYTFWTPEDAHEVLSDAGYIDIQVIPDPNEYILQNRLYGKIALYDLHDGELDPLDFPPTHFVVVGQKPHRKSSSHESYSTPKEVDYERVFETIHTNEEGIVTIGDRTFEVLSPPLIGTKKNIYQLKEEPDKVIKVVRPDTRNAHNVFKSMTQIVQREAILEEYGTPHVKILDYDQTGPPFRYVIQEAVPEDAPSAAALIQEGKLSEQDIKQMAKIVNSYEKKKEWQLDTNPFSWFRVKDDDGSTKLVYASGKVYKYDEQWEFRKVGLLQWLDPTYIQNAENYAAQIPTNMKYQALTTSWSQLNESQTIWKKYLDPSVQPQLSH